MFTFEKTDDGYKAEVTGGKVVARITTARSEPQFAKDPTGKQIELAPKVTPLAQDERLFHFTGTKLTAVQISALLEEAALQA